MNRETNVATGTKMGARSRGTRAERPLAPASLAHREPFLAIDAIELFMIEPDAFPGQQDVQTAVAEPSALLGQLPQPLADAGVVRPPRFIAVSLRIHPDKSAGTALRVTSLRHRPGRGIPPQSGR